MGRVPCVSRVLLSVKEKEREEEEMERKENFVPPGSLKTNPPTLLLLLL